MRVDTKSKSKGVFIYSGNSTILVLDNRRWGAGSTSTSFPPVPRSSLDVVSRGRKSALPFVRSQEWRTHHQIETNPQSLVLIVNILTAAWVSSRAPCDQATIQSSSRLWEPETWPTQVFCYLKKNPIIVQSIVVQPSM